MRQIITRVGTHVPRKDKGNIMRYKPQIVAPPHVPVTNRLTVEIGAWYFKHLRQSRTILTLPWKGLKSALKSAAKPQVLRADPKARARKLQAMLDAGEVKNRAELARRLGLSRARVTQILSRIHLDN